MKSLAKPEKDKKGFFARLIAKLDKKMQEKAKSQSCCCSENKSEKKSCCS
jgi:hypothetical protein